MLNTLFRAKYLWQIFTETVQVTENSTSMLSVSMCSSKPVSGDRNWSNQGIWIPYLSALFIFKKIPNTHGCCKCGETGTGKNSKSSKPFPGRYDPFWSSKFQDWVVQSKEIPAHVYGFLTVEQRKRKTRNNLTLPHEGMLQTLRPNQLMNYPCSYWETYTYLQRKIFKTYRYVKRAVHWQQHQ